MTNTETKLLRHNERDRNGAKFVKAIPCDCCGKPTNEAERYTDDEVCGSSDGPGFFLCHRKRCMAKRDLESVEARRELYTTGRAAAGR